MYHFLGASDLSLKRITQVYRVKSSTTSSMYFIHLDFELWLDPLDQCAVILMVWMSETHLLMDVEISLIYQSNLVHRYFSLSS